MLTTVSEFERDRVPPRFRIVVMVPLWFERRVRVDDIESLGFIPYEFIEDNKSNARHSDEASMKGGCVKVWIRGAEWW